jgi:hypothetical protein
VLLLVLKGTIENTRGFESFLHNKHFTGRARTSQEVTMAEESKPLKFYAGIGSRTTPPDILKLMTEIAIVLHKKGFILRSGGAAGADTAFAMGAGLSPGRVIFRPEDTYRYPPAIELAAKFHPAWDQCNDYARRLHGRNAMIIMGLELDSPVQFVICWTPPDIPYGGTKLGMRIAAAHNIPVYNLALAECQAQLGKEQLGWAGRLP